MPRVTLSAHYDGQHILLDEPFDLPANCPLMVTVLAPLELAGERASWLPAARQGLARAFGEHEPEYTPADIRR